MRAHNRPREGAEPLTDAPTTARAAPWSGYQHTPSPPPEATGLPSSPARRVGACQRQTLQYGGRRRPGSPKRGAAASAAAATEHRLCCRASPEQSSHKVVNCHIIQGAKGSLLAQAAGQPAVKRVERNASGCQAQCKDTRATAPYDRQCQRKRQPGMRDQVGRQHQHLRVSGVARAQRPAGLKGSSMGGRQPCAAVRVVERAPVASLTSKWCRAAARDLSCSCDTLVARLAAARLMLQPGIGVGTSEVGA